MKTRLIIKYLLVTILLVSSTVGFAQEPTDKEIGFDRELIRKEVYQSKPFIRKELLDQEVEMIRALAIERYKLGKDEWFKKQMDTKNAKIITLGNPSTQRFTGCDNATFDAGINNPFNGWSLTYNTQPYGYNNNTLVTQTNVTGTDLVIDNQTRFAVNSTFSDSYINQWPDTRFARIGNSQAQYRRETISRTFTLNNINDFIFYRFAIILQDPGHDGRPFFAIRMLVNGQPVNCSLINYEAPSASNPNSTPGFNQTSPNSGIWVRPWSSNVIKPADFGATLNSTITIEVSVSDCSASGHFGYGYFDVECIDESQVIQSSTPGACLGIPMIFYPGIELIQSGYSWNIKNAANAVVAGPFTTPFVVYTPTEPGNYTIELNVPYFTTTSRCDITSKFRRSFTVGECQATDCEDCSSFNLQRGEKYLISGWVKEKTHDNKDVQARTYSNSYIQVAFHDVMNNLISEDNFMATGEIIDGWQRIYGEFTVPQQVDDMNIALINKNDDNLAFFDDIRVNPFNGSLKSFVYDQETQKLMAELDENNYSTFYEYDKEGGLIRVKKETENGIYTIQESRTSNPKQ